jgi:zinc transport system permease protein
MRVCKRFKTVTVCAAVVSVVSFFAGAVFSYQYAAPTGASTVIVNMLFFLVFWGIEKRPRKADVDV